MPYFHEPTRNDLKKDSNIIIEKANWRHDLFATGI